VTSSLASQLCVLGYALLNELACDQATVTGARELGAICTLPDVPTVQVLAPREREEAPLNVYSGVFGTQEFPMHTDLAHWFLPPRYFALRCVVGASDVYTRLIDGHLLVDSFGANKLFRVLLQPRRPIRGTHPLLRLLDRDISSPYRLRWDSLFTVAATPGSASKCKELFDWLENAPQIAISLSRPGDVLVIDNWRMLHGRSAVSEVSRGRRPDRVYLTAIR